MRMSNALFRCVMPMVVFLGLTACGGTTIAPNFVDRDVATGFDPVAWGENLAGRMTTEEDALQQLENAPAHDAMMNATTVEAFGLGVSGPSRDTRWVLVMATEH